MFVMVKRWTMDAGSKTGILLESILYMYIICVRVEWSMRRGET